MPLYVEFVPAAQFFFVLCETQTMRSTDLFAPFPDELQLAATPSVSNPPLIEWTSAWGDLFFRVKGADPQILWCVLGRGAPAKRPLSKARLATLNKYISAAYAGRTFFRVVPFPDGDEWALVRPKRALVKSPTQRKGASWKWSADFPAPQGEIEWLSQPMSWFENWLRENANDELQAAREFMHLSDDEQNWLPVCRELQTRAHWKKLMPGLQKLSARFFYRQPVKWYLILIASNMKHKEEPFWSTDCPPVPALTDCFELLWQRFPLDYQQQLWRGIDIRGEEAAHTPPRFETASTPTQHERLEAALLWRDFGREIGESARIEAALSQLLAIESSD